MAAASLIQLENFTAVPPGNFPWGIEGEGTARGENTAAGPASGEGPRPVLEGLKELEPGSSGRGTVIVPALGSGEHYRFKYAVVPPFAVLWTGYAHFFPGEYVRDTGDDPDRDFIFSQLAVTF